MFEGTVGVYNVDRSASRARYLPYASIPCQYHDCTRGAVPVWEPMQHAGASRYRSES